jgi:hypothetical protein
LPNHTHTTAATAAAIAIAVHTDIHITSGSEVRTTLGDECVSDIRELNGDHFSREIRCEGNESILMGLVVELDNAAALAGARALTSSELHLKMSLMS